MNVFPATHKMPANAAWGGRAGHFAANTPTTAKLKIHLVAAVPAHSIQKLLRKNYFSLTPKGNCPSTFL